MQLTEKEDALVALAFQDAYDKATNWRPTPDDWYYEGYALPEPVYLRQRLGRDLFQRFMKQKRDAYFEFASGRMRGEFGVGDEDFIGEDWPGGYQFDPWGDCDDHLPSD